MRMWLVDPKLLCRQHLLGEHRELHMFVGHIKRRKDVAGYMYGGLLDPSKLQSRHAELAREMERRGYFDCSPLEEVDTSYIYGVACVDIEANLKDLASRCQECRRRQEEAQNEEESRNH